MYVYYNPNVARKTGSDCVIRAIAKVTDQTWNNVFSGLMNVAFHEKDMPSTNHVWGKYLKDLGFRKYIIPDRCPNCYTVRDFCVDHPIGRYVLAADSHVIAAINGNWFDTWDSGDEPVMYYWKEKTHAK